jgi:hypothetical protein
MAVMFCTGSTGVVQDKKCSILQFSERIMRELITIQVGQCGNQVRQSNYILIKRLVVGFGI